MSDKKTIFIKSNMKQNEDESHPLALFEQDERHPIQHDADGKEIQGSKGEVYVSGDEVVEAFPTPGVISALKADRIVECSADGKVSETSKTETKLAKDSPGAEELSSTEEANAPSDDQKKTDQGAKK